MGRHTIGAFLIASIALASGPFYGQAASGLKDSFCLDCHSDRELFKTNSAGRGISLFVDAKKLAASAHGTNACVTCHADVTAKHPDDNRGLQPVTCAGCHEQQGNGHNAGIHGRALKAGRAESATCQDCHGAHAVLAAAADNSPMHFTRQAETCGECHDREARDVAASVHGKATAAGKRDAPVCTDCHSEHRTETLKRTSPLEISRTICGECHASERLNSKYNLPRDRVKTFFESYHGLASKYGSTLAANCGSCHGYHKILRSTDPESTIHKNHLVATCGKCHPGATEKFALGKVHVDAASSNSANGGDGIGGQINWWVRRIYLLLIFGVVGAMFLHNALLFRRKVSAHLRARARPVRRMNLTQRWQHAALALSFIALAITGFALKFPDSWLARAMGSSEPFRRWAHRVAGIILLLAGVYHLIYIVASAEGRRLVKDFWPIRKDAADLWTQVRYLAGWRKERPKVGRFGYAEKMEYWAVVWGIVVMGVTGLMIWFKMEVTQFLARWTVDVALNIHYYEAVLACLAIVVWHFYHVIFDPDVYPINPACWDGNVSDHWQSEEHPLENPRRMDNSLREANGEVFETVLNGAVHTRRLFVDNGAPGDFDI
jgi:formate dehydrogenase gamma subunit